MRDATGPLGPLIPTGDPAEQSIEFLSNGILLPGHLAEPPASAAVNARRRPGVVIAPPFPSFEAGSKHAMATYPELADRVAEDCGYNALAFGFRGTAGAEGEFSLGNWLTDLRAAITVLQTDDRVGQVWVCGFGLTAALAIWAAALDQSIAGVAALGCPADLDDWAADPKRAWDYAHRCGVVSTSLTGWGIDAWAREMRECRPVSRLPAVLPRPVLVVHGDQDEWVSGTDVLALFDAAEGQLEVHRLHGANQHLRHDPRALAILLGWLQRQGPG